MDPSTLTHNLRPLLVEGLVEGLVELQVGTDRRMRVIALTPRGRAVRERARVRCLGGRGDAASADGELRGQPA
jgi:DNA-binding MarR family transcriptional regulator